MPARWKTGGFWDKRNHLFKELNKVFWIAEDGKISGSLDLDKFVGLFTMMLDFDEQIPISLQTSLVRSGMFSARKVGVISAESLETSVKQGAKKFLKMPAYPYVGLGTVSIQRSVFATSKITSLKKVNGVSLAFPSQLSTKFDLRGREQEAQRFVPMKEDESYTYFVFHTKGRTPDEAAQTGLKAVDLLRAIWNFDLNWGTFRISYGGIPGPYNQIVRGPYFSMHEKPGLQMIDGIWSDDSFPTRSASVVGDSKKIARLSIAEKEIRKQLTRIPYRAETEAWFLRYCNALDHSAPHEKALALWSLLEACLPAGWFRKI